MRQISYLNDSPSTTHLLFGMIRRLAAWRPRHVLRAMLPIAFAALLSAPCVHAEITVTGDVQPEGLSLYDETTNVYIGNTSYGSVTVDDGSTVGIVKRTFLGNEAGSAGTLTLQGEGTTWTTDSYIMVGKYGTGTLKITNGASMSTSKGYISRNSGSSGTAIVDGEGSSWTTSGSFSVGPSDVSGTLSISDGGALSVGRDVFIGAGGILTIDLGYGSSLTVGNDIDTITDISNWGTLRLVAGAGAASGTYTPMSYDTIYRDPQTLGGVWNADDHTVTVNDADLALAGTAKTIDLETTQRLLIVDAATGQIAGASFMAADAPTNYLTFTASVMESSELSALESLLGTGEEILVGWDFDITGIGYTDGDPVYLSLEIGSGYDLSDLAIWLFDESTWTEYDASDLAYDETYASFTVTDFSGYAVTASAPVPIPGAVWLLGSGLAALVGIRRRKA